MNLDHQNQTLLPRERLDDSIIRELAWESYPENDTRNGYNPQDNP
jgi:hypothetical protein